MKACFYVFMLDIDYNVQTHPHTQKCIAAGHGPFYCVHLLELYGRCTSGSEQVVSPI